jgi:hypothetical protein
MANRRADFFNGLLAHIIHELVANATDSRPNGVRLAA